ncbi:MAG: AbiH family protein [Cyclobacteriaceae bacterium]
MNKLILIGNGFDLAHGLKTRYDQFLFEYLNNAVNHVEAFDKTFDSKLIQLSYDSEKTGNQDDCKSLNELLRMIKNRYTLGFKNRFFSELIDEYNKYGQERWVDIEYFYFDKIVRVAVQMSKYKSELREHVTVDGGNEVIQQKALKKISKYLDDLNTDLKVLKDEFINYLSEYVEPNISIANQSMQDFLSERLHEEKNSYSESEFFFANFNYTSTVKLYIKSLREQFGNLKIKDSNIHGILNQNQSNNPVIFGFGDEFDESYKSIENLNDNRFFENIKSFNYLRSSNYHQLMVFVEKEKFNVSTIGLSCGLSDRTLLSYILTHENCQNIHVHYHKDEQNYLDIAYEISRHFIDSKTKFRNKLISFQKSIECPQLVVDN